MIFMIVFPSFQNFQQVHNLSWAIEGASRWYLRSTCNLSSELSSPSASMSTSNEKGKTKDAEQGKVLENLDVSRVDRGLMER